MFSECVGNVLMYLSICSCYENKNTAENWKTLFLYSSDITFYILSCYDNFKKCK